MSILFTASLFSTLVCRPAAVCWTGVCQKREKKTLWSLYRVPHAKVLETACFASKKASSLRASEHKLGAMTHQMQHRAMSSAKDAKVTNHDRLISCIFCIDFCAWTKKHAIRPQATSADVGMARVSKGALWVSERLVRRRGPMYTSPISVVKLNLPAQISADQDRRWVKQEMSVFLNDERAALLCSRTGAGSACQNTGRSSRSSEGRGIKAWCGNSSLIVLPAIQLHISYI